MKKKESELRAGDVVRGWGIVREVIPAGSDPLWGDKQALSFYDIQDSYYGPGARTMNPDDEVEVLTGRLELSNAYRQIDCDMAKYIADMMQERDRLRKIQIDFFVEYNKQNPLVDD